MAWERESRGAFRDNKYELYDILLKSVDDMMPLLLQS